MNNAPPIPPKTKCSSMTCIDEQISSGRQDDSLSLPSAIDRDSVASGIQQISIKRSTVVSRTRPLLYPGKAPMQSVDSRADTPIPTQPIAPLRNSSTRKVAVNSVILPPGYEVAFPDIHHNESKLDKDFNFHLQDPVTPILPPVTASQPAVSYPMQDHIPVPIQSYKFKREHCLPSSTLPRSRTNTLFTISHNRDSMDSSHYQPIVPAIPPKSKRAVAVTVTQTPVAKPRRIKPEVSKQNISQNVCSPHPTQMVPPNDSPPSFGNNDNTGYPTPNQLLHYPIPLPKKASCDFVSPVAPPRMKSIAAYPVSN